jgi:hypothetical protein
MRILQDNEAAIVRTARSHREETLRKLELQMRTAVDGRRRLIRHF